MKKKILFVCLGNICRSPAAEAVFKSIADKEKDITFTVDSAGTSGWHEGEPADSRMKQHAKKRGYNITSLSRPVIADDFTRFDYIVAMDLLNYKELKKMSSKEYHHKIHLITDFTKNSNYKEGIPDPYYGGADGFEKVLDLLEVNTVKLIQFIKEER